MRSVTSIALAIAATAAACHNADTPQARDAGMREPTVKRPPPAPHVRAFFSLPSGKRSEAFATLSLPEAIDVGISGLQREPPDTVWMQAAIGRYRTAVIEPLLEKMDRETDNSSLEGTLDMLDAALALLPDYRLSRRDFERCAGGARKLKGQLAQGYASTILERLGRRVVGR